MKKLITIFIFFIIIFGQLCFAAENWVSYKNNNKIILDKKIVSKADITIVGLFINTGKYNKFQTLNIPLKLSDKPTAFNVDCSPYTLVINNEKPEIKINSLTISGKIRLSQTKAATKHWLYVEIPELTSTIDYSVEPFNSFIGKTSTETYKKSNFLFTTGIAPKELIPYSDRLMQRAFDFTYKWETSNKSQTSNKEETFSLTLFSALNSVTYTDGAEWCPDTLKSANSNTDNTAEIITLSDPDLDISKATITNNTESSEKTVDCSETTSVNTTEQKTETQVATETNTEPQNTSITPYLLAGILIIVASIWIFVRMKKDDNNNTVSETNHETQEKQQKPELIEQFKPIEETEKNIRLEEKQQADEIMPITESKPIENIDTTEKAKPVPEPEQNEETNTLDTTGPTQQDLNPEALNNTCRLNFCPNCGEKIFEGATFCATCGKKIE